MKTNILPIVSLLLLGISGACATPARGPRPTADLHPLLLSLPTTPRDEGQDGDTELAKQTQNPVADLISLPFQNNTNFGIGPGDDTLNVLNIQPVWPFALSEDWNFVTRTILPVISQPGFLPGESRETGLGDTSFTGFFSPADSGSVILGAGPVIQIPTSTSRRLGSGEWGLGASALALTMPGAWVVGGLVNNVWSVESSDSLFLFQPFVNYNLPDGWYLTTAPIITADWEAPSSQRWLVPLGGGMGKIVRFGKLPVNINLQYYTFVESPTLGPDYQIRFQVQLLFPK